MNRIEYEHAVRKAKAARVWKNRDPNDPAARLAFERDFADLDGERYRTAAVRDNAQGGMIESAHAGGREAARDYGRARSVRW
jgi:hypothetical protein